MSNLIPFDAAGNLPARRERSPFAVSTDLMGGGGGGFPVVSIKGKVFHIRRGDETTLLTKPDTPDEPAASIEAVILGVFPGAGKTAKVFYGTNYTEGSDAKPECYSNDGEFPALDAENKQCESCAACPHNQWGSRISDTGGKGKACADSKRLAIAAVNALNDPMLLRVPAASLKPLTEFNKLLASRGYPFQEVVTKIGFDYTVAHPALTFKPIAVLDDATVDQVAAACDLEVTKQILGSDVVAAAPTIPAPTKAAAAATPTETAPATKPAAKTTKAAAKAAPAATAAPAADDAAKAAAAKAAAAKLAAAQAAAALAAAEAEAAAAEVAAAEATAVEGEVIAAKSTEVQTVDAGSGLASALSDLDFDDA
jgi:hypothetical protein